MTFIPSIKDWFKIIQCNPPFQQAKEEKNKTKHIIKSIEE